MTAFLMSLLLSFQAYAEQHQYKFEIAVVQGTPGGSEEKGDRVVLTSPVIIVRHAQQGQISVTQSAPIVVGKSKQGTNDVFTLTQEHTGVVVRVTPIEQEDGTVFVKGSVQLKEVINSSTILERTLKFHEAVKQDALHTIPLYNPNSYAKKHFSGNEIWIELKVAAIEPAAVRAFTPQQPRVPSK